MLAKRVLVHEALQRRRAHKISRNMKAMVETVSCELGQSRAELCTPAADVYPLSQLVCKHVPHVPTQHLRITFSR